MLKKYNHIIIFMLVCLFAFMHAFMQSMPITTSFYFEKLFHLKSSSIINLYSVYFIACIMMQIPIGIFFAKYGLRNVVIVSLLISIFGIVLHWSSSYPIILAISRFISGVGCASAYLAAVYVAMNFFETKYLVLLIGIIEAVSTCGSIAASNPLYSLLSSFGWGITNLVIIFAFVLILFGSYLFIPISNPNELVQRNTESKFFTEFLKVITNKAVILLMIYAFLNWFIMMSFAGFWIRDYMINIHGYSTETSLMLSNIYWGAFLVGNLLIGLFTDSFKKIKIIAWTLSKLTLLTFLVMVIPSVFGYTLIVVFCLFAGISGVTIILAFAFIPYITQNAMHKDVITSIVNISIISGGIAGQYAFGAIAHSANFSNVYFNNELFSNGYYLGLWLYVLAAFLAIVVFYKLSKLLSKNYI